MSLILKVKDGVAVAFTTRHFVKNVVVSKMDGPAVGCSSQSYRLGVVWDNNSVE